MAEAAQPLDDSPTLYERDFYLWCHTEAELLRLRRFGEADLPNIVEELQSMGNSLRSSLRSSDRLVIMHLLKWQFQLEFRGPSWESTIGRERDHVADIEGDNPSLRSEARRLIEDGYPRARRAAARETRLPLAAFPPECPYTLEQLRDPEWMPE